MQPLTQQDKETIDRLIAALEEELIKHPIVLGAEGIFRFQLPSDLAEDKHLLGILSNKYSGGSVRTGVAYDNGKAYFEISRSKAQKIF